MQMEYIRLQTQSKDGKLLAIGHSMGGILLYAMLSKCGKVFTSLLYEYIPFSPILMVGLLYFYSFTYHALHFFPSMFGFFCWCCSDAHW